MRALIIDNDASCCDAVAVALRSEGITVDIVDTGIAGVARGRQSEYDLLILELNLTDLSGFEVLKTLRNDRITTPAIVLSRRAEIEDKLKSLELGADDYITKPYHKDELLLRIRAISRRISRLPSIIRIGSLVIDKGKDRVSVEGKPVRLTPFQYRLLLLLAERLDEVVEMPDILRRLYGISIDPKKEECVRTQIHRIRRKIACREGCDHIDTIRDRGYMLRTPALPSVAAE